MPVGLVNGLVGGPALAFNPYRSPEPPRREPRVEIAVWEKYFRAVATLLPTLARGLDSDLNPPQAVRSMLQRSPLLVKAAELLHNDSAVEIGAQEDLYNGLLDFIERLRSHTLTSHLVYDDLLRHTVDEQLISTCLPSRQPTTSLFGDSSVLRNRVRGRAKAPEKMQSLASLVAVMSLQCGKICRTATSLHNSFQTEEEQQLLVLCRRFVDLANAHQASRAPEATTYPSDPMDLDIEEPPPPDRAKFAVSANTRAQTQAQAVHKAHEEMTLWHRKNCVGEVADERLLGDFYYSRQANALLQHKSSVQPGRMKKLISELTMLSTALPEGIYVRHGESRLDAMKVLMVGPVGTPYEGGLFEFDLFCPENYPVVAPLVNFKTTGGGRVRFNPNLYEDGKGELDAYPAALEISDRRNPYAHLSLLQCVSRSLALGRVSRGARTNPRFYKYLFRYKVRPTSSQPILPFPFPPSPFSPFDNIHMLLRFLANANASHDSHCRALVQRTRPGTDEQQVGVRVIQQYDPILHARARFTPLAE